jgi:hypothetical protein
MSARKSSKDLKASGSEGARSLARRESKERPPEDEEARECETWMPTEFEDEDVVAIGWEIRQIKDIDCVGQKFYKDFNITMKWYRAALKNSGPGVLTEEEAGVPIFWISNSIDIEQRETGIEIREHDPPGIVTMVSRFSGELSEFMELDMFPIDVQELSVVMRFKDPKTKIRVIHDMAILDETVELIEWWVHFCIMATTREKGYPCWVLKSRVQRKANYYMMNIILMVGAISSIAFFCFMFPAEAWNDRSNYIAMLLLTTVTFKQVIEGATPKLACITVMDLYLYLSFLVLLFLILQSAGIKYLLEIGIISKIRVVYLDTSLAMAVSVLWIFINVWYFKRFYDLETEQSESIGPRADFISTNQEGRSAMAVLLGASAKGDD